MNTYMVTLADPTGRDQRVLVRAPKDNTEADVVAYILDPATRSTKGESVIPGARVIGIRKLSVRPPHGTVMPEMTKASA